MCSRLCRAPFYRLPCFETVSDQIHGFPEAKKRAALRCGAGASALALVPTTTRLGINRTALSAIGIFRVNDGFSSAARCLPALPFAIERVATTGLRLTDAVAVKPEG